MAMTYSPGRTNFGLLPEPEGRSTSFIASSLVNLTILGVVLYIGMTAKHVLEQHYEMTELFVPANTPPERVKQPPPAPKLQPIIEHPKLELEPRKIDPPKPKPEPKPIQMDAKLNQLQMKQMKQQIVLAPQPKAALAAAMTAENNVVKASTAPVHFGQAYGVMPNPNATRPATIAAIGDPYGGMQGTVGAPRGVVGSTGLGNGTKYGSNAGVTGKVGSAGIPGANGAGTGAQGVSGKVASAGIPVMAAAAPAPRVAPEQVQATEVEVLSKPAPAYTSEAKQLRIQGDVVLSVTFLASGRVIVHSVVQGLGHGLDEEARRVAGQIRFRPATTNGRPVDFTTKITITFQLA